MFGENLIGYAVADAWNYRCVPVKPTVEWFRRPLYSLESWCNLLNNKSLGK